MKTRLSQDHEERHETDQMGRNLIPVARNNQFKAHHTKKKIPDLLEKKQHLSEAAKMHQSREVVPLKEKRRQRDTTPLESLASEETHPSEEDSLEKSFKLLYRRE